MHPHVFICIRFASVCTHTSTYTSITYPNVNIQHTFSHNKSNKYHNCEIIVLVGSAEYMLHVHICVYLCMYIYICIIMCNYPSKPQCLSASPNRNGPPPPPTLGLGGGQDKLEWGHIKVLDKPVSFFDKSSTVFNKTPIISS